jgi:hypothetical protein
MGFTVDASGSDAESLPYHASPPICPQGEGARVAVMVDMMLRHCPKSGAAALRELRAAFPESPLTLRVAALELLRRRSIGHRPE